MNLELIGVVEGGCPAGHTGRSQNYWSHGDFSFEALGFRASTRVPSRLAGRVAGKQPVVKLLLPGKIVKYETETHAQRTHVHDI